MTTPMTSRFSPRGQARLETPSDTVEDLGSQGFMGKSFRGGLLKITDVRFPKIKVKVISFLGVYVSIIYVSMGVFPNSFFL